MQGPRSGREGSAKRKRTRKTKFGPTFDVFYEFRPRSWARIWSKKSENREKVLDKNLRARIWICANTLQLHMFIVSAQEALADHLIWITWQIDSGQTNLRPHHHLQNCRTLDTKKSINVDNLKSAWVVKMPYSSLKNEVHTIREQYL